jgi:hypothetical protein
MSYDFNALKSEYDARWTKVDEPAVTAAGTPGGPNPAAGDRQALIERLRNPYRDATART